MAVLVVRVVLLGLFQDAGEAGMRPTFEGLDCLRARDPYFPVRGPLEWERGVDGATTDGVCGADGIVRDRRFIVDRPSYNVRDRVISVNRADNFRRGGFISAIHHSFNRWQEIVIRHVEGYPIGRPTSRGDVSLGSRRRQVRPRNFNA